MVPWIMKGSRGTGLLPPVDEAGTPAGFWVSEGALRVYSLHQYKIFAAGRHYKSLLQKQFVATHPFLCSLETFFLSRGEWRGWGSKGTRFLGLDVYPNSPVDNEKEQRHGPLVTCGGGGDTGGVLGIQRSPPTFLCHQPTTRTTWPRSLR